MGASARGHAAALLKPVARQWARSDLEAFEAFAEGLSAAPEVELAERVIRREKQRREREAGE